MTKLKKAKRPRRTNEERSAETRGRLIDATIELLYSGGYAATTTISVAERAGVSRGAMMHHFSSRADLLLTVAEHILAEQRRQRIEMLGDTHGLDRFYAAADVSWAVQRQPSSIAFLEIMMATRSDPDLRKGMQPLIRLVPELRQQSAERMAADLPSKQVKKLNHMVRLHLAALRGLAIELMFSADEDDIEATRQLLIQYERTFVKDIIEPAKRRATSAKRT